MHKIIEAIDGFISDLEKGTTGKKLDAAFSKLVQLFKQNEVKPDDIVPIINKLAEYREKWAAKSGKEDAKDSFAKRFVTFAFIQFKEAIKKQLKDMSANQFFDMLDAFPSISLDPTKGSFVSDIRNRLASISLGQDLDAITTMRLAKHLVKMEMGVSRAIPDRLGTLLLNDDVEISTLDKVLEIIEEIKNPPSWLCSLNEKILGQRTSHSAFVAALDAAPSPMPVEMTKAVGLQSMLNALNAQVSSLLMSNVVIGNASVCLWVPIEMDGQQLMAQFSGGVITRGGSTEYVVTQALYAVSKPEVVARSVV